jgi:hypothetical protein
MTNSTLDLHQRIALAFAHLASHGVRTRVTDAWDGRPLREDLVLNCETPGVAGAVRAACLLADVAVRSGRSRQELVVPMS